MWDILVEATLRATLIAVAMLLILSLLRVRSAAVRHRVWTVVLLAMLVLPLWVARAPEVALRVLPATRSSAAATVEAPPAFHAPAAETTVRMERAAEQGLAGGAASLTSAASAVEGGNWRIGLLIFYLAGSALLLARLVIGTVRVTSLAREARVVNGRLTSARIAAPYTVGLLRPKIVLPEGWDRWPTPRLQAVLEHECAHVSRRDPLVQWLALLNRALFWFHPLAWWLERRLAVLAEEACDAVVLERGYGPTDYSDLLLDLARDSARRRIRHVAGMPMPGSALPARIAKILEGRVAPPGSRAAAAGAGVVAMLAVALLGTITLAQDAASPPLIPAADSFTPLPEYWHDDDEWHLEVAPIMTREEAEAYRSLRSVEERERFIGAFWLRRDSTPGTLHNERRKEYERRIHYAEEHFRDAGSPGAFGYQTTRGAVYVLLGQPDSIEPVNEDGLPYEYWRYSDVNGTGDAFTVRVARWHRIGCGPAYEIVEPAPTRTFQGYAWLGTGSTQPLTVRVYSVGLVTISIPIEHATVRRVRATGDRAGAVPPDGRFIGFDFGLPTKEPPAGKQSLTIYGREGLACTVQMPPGQYLLNADAELLSGEHVTDSVAFEVNAP